MQRIKVKILSRISLLEELLSVHTNACKIDGKNPSEDLICERLEGKLGELRIILDYIKKSEVLNEKEEF